VLVAIINSHTLETTASIFSDITFHHRLSLPPSSPTQRSTAPRKRQLDVTVATYLFVTAHNDHSRTLNAIPTTKSGFFSSFANCKLHLPAGYEIFFCGPCTVSQRL
jgi:hypothetical protein